jgi:hypothetical protein
VQAAETDTGEKGEIMSTEKSILDMARGAISERVDYEMGRVMRNIMDPNTSPTEKREITLTIKLSPDDERAVIGVSVTAKSKLAPTVPIKTALYAHTDSYGEFHAVEMTPQIPGQIGFDGDEAEQTAILRIAK